MRRRSRLIGQGGTRGGMTYARPNFRQHPASTGHYFLDVDGTLIDIAETPDAVHIDTALLDLIARLYRECGGAMALVSGRSISDLETTARCTAPAAGGATRVGTARCGRAPVDARGTARGQMFDQGGAGPGVGQPSRLDAGGQGVDDRVALSTGAAIGIFRAAPDGTAGARMPMRGLKCSTENAWPKSSHPGSTREPPWRNICRSHHFMGRRPVFIGDDLNDEHGFAEVNRLGGISIKVGKGQSCAQLSSARCGGSQTMVGRSIEGKPMNNLDLALIGNCTIGALIDARATITWGCFPRFDGDPVFCSLLREYQRLRILCRRTRGLRTDRAALSGKHCNSGNAHA